jgi:hypothetical protein
VIHRTRCRWSCMSVREKCSHLAIYIKRKRWVIAHEHFEDKTGKTEKWERYDRVRAAHADAGKGAETRLDSAIIEVWHILISIKLLKNEKALWNMHIDTINVKDTLIFELEEHFKLYIIEYISFDHIETYVNFVETRNINTVLKETSWKFHLCLDHCQLEIIN